MTKKEAASVEDQIAEALASAEESRQLAATYRADGDEENAAKADADAAEAQARAEELGAPERETAHHQVAVTNPLADDDPAKGTVDDPDAVDPHAHLRTQAEPEDDEDSEEE